MSEDESFSLSLTALVRCYQKGMADNYQYLLRACVNEHRDWLRQGDRQRQFERGLEPLSDQSENPWPGEDYRMDFEDALCRLSRVGTAGETYAKVARMVRDGYVASEIAAEIKNPKTGKPITEDHVLRLKKKVASELRRLMKGYEDE